MSYRIFANALRKPIASKTLLLSSGTLLAALAASPSAQAQVTELEGITIYSANKTPTEAAKVGSSVEVITEQQLASQSRSFVKDYLEQLPGVNFSQNGPPGSTTSISVRGANAAYVKVLVDGIDISDPSATTTQTAFEHLLVGDVSRIEVLKGSQSGLYGGDAVAGVISIETKKATKLGFSHSGGAEYGAYNTFRGAYTAGYATANGSNISLSVQGVDTDGFSAAAVGREDDGYQNLTFSGRGEYILSPSAKVFFAARSLDAEHNYDGFAPPTYALGDTDDFGKSVQHAGRVGTEFSFLDGAFQNTIAVQGMKVERDNFSNGLSSGWFEGDRVKGEYKGVLTFNDQLSLLAGADWEQTGAENNNSTGRETADVTGTYAQLMMEPIDGLVLTGGGRIDDHSAFGNFNTYRLTAAYLVPGTETKFRASRGTGFRAPSLDELYGSYGFAPDYGNPNLKPEESESWDAGIEQGFLDGRIKLGVTYFELDTDNLILYNFSCGMPGALCLTNVEGTTQRKGVELSAVALVTSGLAVTTGYTYVDTELESGDRLPRVPRHNFVVGFDYQPIDKLELNVTAKYVADTIDSNGADLDDYFLLSAKASYEVVPGWKAYVRGENLLDEDYQTTTGYNTPGLSVYGGLTMSLPNN
ncbi:TonB-dependent receptor domain-containing protein [Hyphomicrobium sp. LHD-15]|uniref:TonB-dependent receptor plug domain-containing protein n=1 Tax=Hyphomicrobium sp. LHD-15 TaxID=3072142 RepID=UPI00281022A6|nr:TonB-dependent receptor [Hyphomicrobium sp. LHD-15]MDQ8699573.1 TonB-dependent receptor [Hyphomicrobium sp. LHD-15]